MKLVVGLLLVSSVVHAQECRKLPAGQKFRLSMQPSSSLADIVAWAASFTCKTFVFADRGAAGERITVVAPEEMTSKQAWNVFLASLDAHDLVAVEKDGVVTIKDKPGVKRCATAVAPPPPSPPMPPPDVTPPPEPSLDPAIAAAITRLSDDHYTIRRGGIDAVLADTTHLARGARIVPSMKDGKPIGFKLYAIRPGSFYNLIGLENGDTLETMNGLSLATPDDALKAYSQLRDATRVDLGLTRRGVARHLVVDIVP